MRVLPRGVFIHGKKNRRSYFAAQWCFRGSKPPLRSISCIRSSTESVGMKGSKLSPDKPRRFQMRKAFQWACFSIWQWPHTSCPCKENHPAASTSSCSLRSMSGAKAKRRTGKENKLTDSTPSNVADREGNSYTLRRELRSWITLQKRNPIPALNWKL
jgi:hypothetical protein